MTRPINISAKDTCKICGTQFTVGNTFDAATTHVKREHNLNASEYWEQYVLLDPPICDVYNCNNKTRYLSYQKCFAKYCDECKNDSSVTSTHNVTCSCGVKFKTTNSTNFSKCLKCRKDSTFDDKILGTDYVVCPYCSEKVVVLNKFHLLSCSNKTEIDLHNDFPNAQITSTEFILGKHGGRGNIIKNEFGTFRCDLDFEIFKSLKRIGMYFEYESICIPYFNEHLGKNSFYVPDFYLPYLNLIIEGKTKRFSKFIDAVNKKDAAMKLFNFEYVFETNFSHKLITKIINFYSH